MVPQVNRLIGYRWEDHGWLWKAQLERVHLFVNTWRMKDVTSWAQFVSSLFGNVWFSFYLHRAAAFWESGLFYTLRQISQRAPRSFDDFQSSRPHMIGLWQRQRSYCQSSLNQTSRLENSCWRPHQLASSPNCLTKERSRVEPGLMTSAYSSSLPKIYLSLSGLERRPLSSSVRSSFIFPFFLSILGPWRAP